MVISHTAKPMQRLAAFALDYLLISAYILILAVVGSLFAFGSLEEQVANFFSSLLVMDVLVFATTVLPISLYFAAAEASLQGGTWGKRRMHIRVLRTDGSRLSIERAMFRAAVKFLPWQIAHISVLRLVKLLMESTEPPAWVNGGVVLAIALAATYVVLLFVSPAGRTVHDWVAGSVVIAEEGIDAV